MCLAKGFGMNSEEMNVGEFYLHRTLVVKRVGIDTELYSGGTAIILHAFLPENH